MKGSLENDLHRQTPETSTPAASNSLQDLYAKKKECQAVLGILEKLDMLREAPRRFDSFVESHRLHAAIAHLSNSLSTLFSPDVASVQALSKVGEELMLRKGATEELCTAALCDLIFLRTGAPTRNQDKAKALRQRTKTSKSSRTRRGNSYNSRHRGRSYSQDSGTYVAAPRDVMNNPSLTSANLVRPQTQTPPPPPLPPPMSPLPTLPSSAIRSRLLSRHRLA